MCIVLLFYKRAFYIYYVYVRVCVCVYVCSSNMHEMGLLVTGTGVVCGVT